MPDPSPFPLSHRPPASDTGGVLPAHLYGTRAALFHLLREAAPTPFAGPAADIVALPAPAHGMSRTRKTPWQVVPQPAPQVGPQAGPHPVAAAPADPIPPATRAALGDMLQSDNFDFRSFGTPD